MQDVAVNVIVSTLVAPAVVGVPLQYFTLTCAAVAVDYRTGYQRNASHLLLE
jgi:hypothetical protein